MEDKATGNDTIQTPTTTAKVPSEISAEDAGVKTLAYYAAKWAALDAATPETKIQRVQDKEAYRKDAMRDRASEAWNRFASRLGEQYGRCRIENFTMSKDEAVAARQEEVVSAIRGYAEELTKNISQCVNVLLYGPSGTGKDHLLTSLCHVAIFIERKRVHWTRGSKFFYESRDAMTWDREPAFILSHTAADVLYFSDPVPPVGALTPHQASMLYEIIDERYRMKRPTWCSLNVSNIKEAEDSIGVATMDRLQEGALTAKCQWPSYRRR